MNKQGLINYLNDSKFDYSRENILRLLDGELEKEPEEMDNELISFCLEHLKEDKEDKEDKAEKEKTEKAEAPKREKQKSEKSKIIRLKPLIIAAAVLASLACASVTAYAGVYETIHDKFVTFFDGYARIDYEKKNTDAVPELWPHEESELYKELKAGGIDNIFLPAELYTMKREKLEWQNVDKWEVVNIDYPDEDIALRIHRYSGKEWVMNPDVTNDNTNSKKINVNGIDVYMFEMKTGFPKRKATTVSYTIGLTEYCINVPMNIAEAEEFMKTMC